MHLTVLRHATYSQPGRTSRAVIRIVCLPSHTRKSKLPNYLLPLRQA